MLIPNKEVHNDVTLIHIGWVVWNTKRGIPKEFATYPLTQADIRYGWEQTKVYQIEGQ